MNFEEINLEEMNLEEFKKEVLIYGVSLSRFIKFFNGIEKMAQRKEYGKALSYANFLSYATVKCTKHEVAMYKRNVNALGNLIQECYLNLTNEVSVDKAMH